jgi:hypothetical protein
MSSYIARSKNQPSAWYRYALTIALRQSCGRAVCGWIFATRRVRKGRSSCVSNMRFWARARRPRMRVRTGSSRLRPKRPIDSFEMFALRRRMVVNVCLRYGGDGKKLGCRQVLPPSLRRNASLSSVIRSGRYKYLTSPERGFGLINYELWLWTGPARWMRRLKFLKSSMLPDRWMRKRAAFSPAATRSAGRQVAAPMPARFGSLFRSTLKRSSGPETPTQE